MKASAEDPSTGFSKLGLPATLVAAVAALGYEEPTPIQREAIPVLLSGKDLVGQAGTGTGKTAAFALPTVARLAADESAKRDRARAMILVPTRELAMQVAEATHKYAKGSNLNVVPLYGGAPMDQQIRALRRGADIVVATPGRALDHIRRKTLDLSTLQILVLDEADEMLDMGFAEDLEAIINETPEARQTALFAATMAPRIAAIASRHLRHPSRVTIEREKRAQGKLPRIRQTAYIVSRDQKTAALGRVLEFEDPKSAIVFCRTRIEVDQLTDTLNAHGYGAKALHGGMEQRDRDRVMQLFRKEKADILVATDVAARGLDIDHISHVINYDVPNAPETYVHRIGRTGRIGREGVAITLADPRERRVLRNIEALTRQPIEVKTLPSIADLRARRLDSTRAAIRERIAAGNLDEGRAMAGALGDESDILDIAAAAILLVHDASDQGTPLQPVKEDVPRGRDTFSGRDQAARPFRGREGRPERPGRPERNERYERPGRESRPSREVRPVQDMRQQAEPERDKRGPVPERDKRGPVKERRPSAAGLRHRDTDEPLTVLRIGAGKAIGIRPADLVGAIAGEANVPSKVLGAIRVDAEHSTVEVPEALATRIMSALRATKIRGHKVEVRREKE
jgi:ATP-dependent RNA helicase DeaD